MKIKVTQEHVQRAVDSVRASSYLVAKITTCCPVYQAAKDAGLEVVAVGYTSIHLADKTALQAKPDSCAAMRAFTRVLSQDIKEEGIAAYPTTEVELEFDPIH